MSLQRGLSIKGAGQSWLIEEQESRKHKADVFSFSNHVDLLSEWLNTSFKASSFIPNRETLERG